MRLAGIILLGLGLTGCATGVVYNPVETAEISLNENGLKTIQEGQTLEEVHRIMGDKLVIGYAFQAPDYKPLTIANPYKSEAIKGTDFYVEYYIDAVRQPDGIVSDNELMPLIFKNGRLIGRGWPLVNSLFPSKLPA